MITTYTLSEILSVIATLHSLIIVSGVDNVNVVSSRYSSCATYVSLPMATFVFKIWDLKFEMLTVYKVAYLTHLPWLYWNAYPKKLITWHCFINVLACQYLFRGWKACKSQMI